MDIRQEIMNGMTWGFNGRRGMWASEAAADSMNKMANIGANWVALAFGVHQAHPQATIIPFGEAPAVDDDEVRRGSAGCLDRRARSARAPTASSRPLPTLKIAKGSGPLC